MVRIQAFGSTLALIVGSVIGSATAAAATPGPVLDPVGRVVEPSLRTLGQFQTAQLRGVDGTLYVPFGIRLDEVVTEARLTLRYSYSPALLPELSHLWVKLNGETVATVPLPRDGAGREQSVTLNLDPRDFTDYNQLQVQLIGHYTLECEDPQHSSLWATVSPDSVLYLRLQPLALADDLALLPAPFFDRRDPSRLELPFVWQGMPDTAALETAGIVASWFGALADYRSARFPVVLNALPDRHAVVFATNDRLPEALSLRPVETPTVSVLPHPQLPAVKLLVLQGRDAAQLKSAATALVLGHTVLSGPQSVINTLVDAPRRPAYDAPRWLPGDRPVRFGELVEEGRGLESTGHAPSPIRINLRVAPDLFTWQQAGVPMDLRYRYTAPPEKDNSSLSVSINDEFVHAFALEPEKNAAGDDRVLLPLLDDGGAGLSEDLVIPAFQVGADNQLQFRFAFDVHKSGRCQGSATDTVRASIDPDSTIDLSAFPHYVALPNLALFANAGFPFTRYADLAETLVVVPNELSVAHIETALFLFGRLGRQTGTAGSKLRVIASKDLAADADADLLVIDGRTGRDLLAEWRSRLPVVLSETTREFRPRAPAPWYVPRIWSDAQPVADQGELNVSAQGPMAALLGFESPLRPKRSAVVLTATSAQALSGLVDVLEDSGRVRSVRGDTVLLRGTTLTSQQGGPKYRLGHLPWLTRARFFLSQFPLALVVFALLAGLTASFFASRYLYRQARERLNP